MVVKELGPYKKPDGRNVMTLVMDDGRRTTIQYARYLLEKETGIKLGKNMVIHHIDGDRSNDSLDNIEVMTRGQHSKLHNTKPAVTFECPYCHITFELSGRRLSTAKYSGRRHYCSQKCSGLDTWNGVPNG